MKPKLKKPLNLTVTYHDSCCLGRRADIYDEPRTLLQAIPGVKLVEMTHHHVNAICCGGGGGGMWLDTYFKQKGMERLSERRIKEAIRVGADVLAVSCPYEIYRFEDALKVIPHDKPMVVNGEDQERKGSSCTRWKTAQSRNMSGRRMVGSKSNVR